MKVSVQTTCPVCRAPSPKLFMNVDERDYWRCEHCEARFLDPRQLPCAEDERAHYRHHENDPDDPRYRKFLARLAEPLLQKLDRKMSCLDYGAGPGPALAAMLRELGHDVALYDPFFRTTPGALDRSYDVITCTEVAEHFHHAADEFDRLDTLLRPGGWIGVMTCFQTDDARFATWHYRRDPTHVVFYRKTTFAVIAEQRNWTCESPSKDVVLMQKRQ